MNGSVRWILSAICVLIVASCAVGPEASNSGDLQAQRPDANPDPSTDATDDHPPSSTADTLTPDPAPDTLADCGSCNSSAHAPKILELSTNVAELVVGSTLVVSAVVTDPDGIDDLIGGVLKDAETGATYGSFSTSASEGAYGLALTWQAIDTVRAITIDANGTPRKFTAVFYDVAGNQVKQDLVVTMRCETKSHTLCGDAGCVDLQTNRYHCGTCFTSLSSEFQCVNGEKGCRSDQAMCGGTCATITSDPENCGSCGKRCDFSDVTGLPQGLSLSTPQCVEKQCMVFIYSANPSSCGDVCGAAGLECRSQPWQDGVTFGLAGYGDFAHVDLASCDEIPLISRYGEWFRAIRCACE